jgi:ferrochelatase
MSDPTGLTGVLLLAYGGPRDESEIEPFLASVTSGRALSPETLRAIHARYDRIGGHSPLPAITDALAAALQARLERAGRFYVAVGNLHSRPTIAEAVEDMVRHRVERAVSIVLVPQFSRATVGRYLDVLAGTMREAGEPFPLTMVRRWSSHPSLVDAFVEKIEQALAPLAPEERKDVEVVFTAHSMPVQAVRGTDVFDAELHTTASDVARRAHLPDWRLAYQSAGRSGGEWLGPSVSEVVAILAAEGKQTALLVPIHFLADNVEIVYDLDVELRRQADELGVRLIRTESLNTSPLLVEALADLAQNPPID